MSLQIINSRNWVRVALINLLIVAIYGWVMRYKIGYSLPIFHQKFLLHAHSHFAFSGWVSQLLMTLMISQLLHTLSASRKKLYESILYGNLITSYGMLISFTVQGYALYSIIFSTLSLVVSFLFAGMYIYDSLKLGQTTSKPWLITAIIFQVLSTAGTFSLIYMLAGKKFQSDIYHASIYWYLHFQYNGWFLFAIIGLFVHELSKRWEAPPLPRHIFWLFAISCFPAYGLSVLWLKLPLPVYLLVIAATLAQTIGWLLLVIHLIKQKIWQFMPNKLSVFMLLVIGIANSIKMSLQLASVIPSISHMAFGYRPIVIAYLHLILLGIITTYLIMHLYVTHQLNHKPVVTVSIIGLLISIAANELVLAIQGISSFSYTLVPWVNDALIGASTLLLLSIGLLGISQFQIRLKKKENSISEYTPTVQEPLIAEFENRKQI